VRESYVRPVTGAREPAPEWRAVWRFRAVAFVLLALVAWAAVVGVNHLLQLGEQNPTNDAPATAPATPGG
jgi:hypothetical protein